LGSCINSVTQPRLQSFSSGASRWPLLPCLRTWNAEGGLNSVSLEQKIAAARKHYVSLLMQLPKDSRVLEFAQCADQLDEADASDCPQTDEAEVALVIPSAEVPAASEPKKRGRPPGSKNKCKACGGTGRVIGTTGVSYDCDCVKADCAA
jgi:hypothetical protein